MARLPVQIVWFKRDLRVTDHAPLAAAAGLGPVLPLFVVEPGFWREPDASGSERSGAGPGRGDPGPPRQPPQATGAGARALSPRRGGSRG